MINQKADPDKHKEKSKENAKENNRKESKDKFKERSVSINTRSTSIVIKTITRMTVLLWMMKRKKRKTGKRIFTDSSTRRNASKYTQSETKWTSPSHQPAKFSARTGSARGSEGKSRKRTGGESKTKGDESHKRRKEKKSDTADIDLVTHTYFNL
jgi:hypothetical protein